MTLAREIWRQRWLSSINELTSLDLQMKSWLDYSITNPHWSFVEFMCRYFDDLLFDYPYEHYIDIGWVTPQEYHIIKYWHDALSKYQSPNNEDYNDEAILKDENWLDIVEQGAKAKSELAKTLQGEEKRVLTEAIDYHKSTDNIA